ncbi:HNH endonuclease [Xenorhabdus bovienii]|uniref:HNH endonuclease n=1 Tax=Xenorhabdus bovienii TaxID=40576 RepID=UPI0023B2B254|nr:HNH endonuclease signature motif containing protein [Xenorhabdus bovienii]MDE9452619.1 HNH endonuclease [Xenorhabdus bovienii]
MNYRELFSKELEDEKTGYFILDTKGTESQHGDVDFVRYLWDRSKFNHLKEGDLFIYRRPKKSSLTKKFHFFGAGKIGTMLDLFDKNDNSENKEKPVQAEIVESYPFQHYLYPEDLEDYEWKIKKRKPGTWMNFFNQYGMNRITKEDFIGVLDYSDGLYIYENKEDVDHFYDNAAATDAVLAIEKGNFFVEDEKGIAKKRAKQSVFSNRVKDNYRNCCALCGINIRALLIASHIIPWSKDKRYRLDPSNGISLCVLHDKLFDLGYITFDDDYKMISSQIINIDPVLSNVIKKFEGVQLRKPAMSPPNKEHLKYHRTHIFKK